jgi:hypothetical protein
MTYATAPEKYYVDSDFNVHYWDTWELHCDPTDYTHYKNFWNLLVTKKKSEVPFWIQIVIDNKFQDDNILNKQFLKLCNNRNDLMPKWIISAINDMDL